MTARPKLRTSCLLLPLSDGGVALFDGDSGDTHILRVKLPHHPPDTLENTEFAVERCLSDDVFLSELAALGVVDTELS